MCFASEIAEIFFNSVIPPAFAMSGWRISAACLSTISEKGNFVYNLSPVAIGIFTFLLTSRSSEILSSETGS